ncbi:hypothetical protein AVDCRST_MAG81-3684 [uncultured Synechococcales cyanobacterium]|uniref:Uncharacterized protein n=1 Tax=uncultured Synechococcales cyanobacterium TaxID=1936017 RepID=A0A6J4VKG2_9CYAN|nr:hypothetical protein AVDCRST_MAG81-3684 [uncultured Synechococcales cyanobacterium]
MVIKQVQQRLSELKVVERSSLPISYVASYDKLFPNLTV